MEGCFTFQWRGCVSDVGFIFKWGGGGHQFWWGSLEKNCRMGERCPNFGKPWTYLACCRGPGCTSHFAFWIYLELVSASLDAIKHIGVELSFQINLFTWCFYFKLFICPPDVQKPKCCRGFTPLNPHQGSNISSTLKPRPAFYVWKLNHWKWSLVKLLG